MAALRVGNHALVCIGLLLVLASKCQARQIFIAAPNTFRLNVPETVSILVHGAGGDVEKFRVSLLDYPGERKEFSITEVNVQPEVAKTVSVKVTPTDILDDSVADPKSKRYVVLSVTSRGFSRKSVILVSPEGGYYFLQTTKPIYKPGEHVQIRVIPLDENLKPSSHPFRLGIVNPQGGTVEDTPSSDLRIGTRPFFTHIFSVPSYPLFGEWMVVLKYGHDLRKNSTVSFTVQEYVLPTFSVKINSPEVILEDDKDVAGHIIAKHTYGKNVQGTAVFRFGVKNEAGVIVFIGKSFQKELKNGKAEFKFDTGHFKNDSRVGWFPRIIGNRFVVEGTVMERATGKRETQVDDRAVFTTSPYALSFKRCIRNFKAGLTTIVAVDALYSGTGRPVANLPVSIMVTDQYARPVTLEKHFRRTNPNGQVEFVVPTSTDHRLLTVQAVTHDGIHSEKFQATGSITLKKYESSSNAYVSVSRIANKGVLKVGERFAGNVFSSHSDIINIYFMIIRRGAVLQLDQLQVGTFTERILSFDVTPQMVPNIRLVVFAVYKGHLIADSVMLEVEHACDPQAEVSINPVFPQPEPGRKGTIEIRGTQGTSVGILAVDEAVYALKRNDLLKREKLFETMAKHDLGCGPGGGINTEQVLDLAGVVVMSNMHTEANRKRNDYGCSSLVRKKRELTDSLLAPYNNHQKECCRLGLYRDKLNRTCEERANVIIEYFKSDESGCAKAFFECCNKAHRRFVSDDRARGIEEGYDELDFDMDLIDESLESSIMIRRDFREVFLFQDVDIGPTNQTELTASLPHSITAWVFQAFGISYHHGMCIAEPRKVEVFRKLFLQLNLPYSVVRKEQIEIPATVYNYDSIPLRVSVSMYGVKGICSSAEPGQKTKPHIITIPGNSAETVNFPVVPLEVGEFEIRVVAISMAGGDIISKILKVVPEGRVVTKEVTIMLDPTNQHKRKRSVIEPMYTDSIDADQNKQISIVHFPVDDSIIPDTERCSISVVGDSLGPVVQTTINDPEKFINLPTGCGEQSIAKMSPTLYILQYLKATGKMTDEIERKAYDFIRKGYANELSYRKRDGSYSAFQSRPSSTWLTAFVIKVFCHASRYVYVDENVVLSGLDWLENNQNSDGSFTERYPVMDKNLMGSVSGSIAMTAFVLITFQECSRKKQEEMPLAAVRALTFLEANHQKLTHPFEMAVVAYALSLSGSEVAQDASNRLKSMSTYDPDQNLRYWPDSNQRRAIETSSYALLTALQMNDIEYAASIVNWMNIQQGYKGGFHSTQDTSIGLQALSQYAIQTRHREVDLECDAKASNDANYKETFKFNKSDSHIVKERDVPNVGGDLYFETKGKGVGMLNVRYQYNVLDKEDLCKFEIKVVVEEAKKEPPPAPPTFPPYPDLSELEPETRFPVDFFSIPPDLIRELGAMSFEEIEDQKDNNLEDQYSDLARSIKSDDSEQNARSWQDKPASKEVKLKLNVCTRYIADRNSDMAIVNVGIVSGFSPVIEDIVKLVESEDLPVSHYEMSGSNVVLYLDEISHTEPVCISFRIVRNFFVDNPQPTTVKVFDYYKPEDVCTEFYTLNKTSPYLRTICEGHVCECAEGGCPSTKLFQELSNVAEYDRSLAEMKLLREACSNFSFVWLVTPVDTTVKNGFRYVIFEVIRVIKEGSEPREQVENEERIFMAAENCANADLKLNGDKYFLMGQDGHKYPDKKTGGFWYRYLLDQNTALHPWYRHLKDASNKNLQKLFYSVGKKLRGDGCHE